MVLDWFKKLFGQESIKTTVNTDKQLEESLLIHIIKRFDEFKKKAKKNPDRFPSSEYTLLEENIKKYLKQEINDYLSSDYINLGTYHEDRAKLNKKISDQIQKSLEEMKMFHENLNALNYRVTIAEIIATEQKTETYIITQRQKYLKKITLIYDDIITLTLSKKKDITNQKQLDKINELLDEIDQHRHRTINEIKKNIIKYGSELKGLDAIINQHKKTYMLLKENFNKHQKVTEHFMTLQSLETKKEKIKEVNSKELDEIVNSVERDKAQFIAQLENYKNLKIESTK
jgi:hypothetical protein